MITAKFSTKYEAVKKRIQRLPELLERSADTFTKKDAVGVIDTFREGISKNSFRLIPLAKITIAKKRKEGKKKPKTPLYGKGEEEKNSYINTFRIGKLKNGYTVYPRWAKHHEANVTLRYLLKVHEEGCVIRKKDGTLIRIPPRPAFAKAFMRHMRKRIKIENVKKVKEAMRNMVRAGNIDLFNELAEKTARTNKYDET